MRDVVVFKTCLTRARTHTWLLIVLILKSVLPRCRLSRSITIVSPSISPDSPAAPFLPTYCCRLFSFCSPCTNSLLIMLYSTTLRSPYSKAGIHALIILGIICPISREHNKDASRKENVYLSALICCLHTFIDIAQ